MDKTINLVVSGVTCIIPPVVTVFLWCYVIGEAWSGILLFN